MSDDLLAQFHPNVVQLRAEIAVERLKAKEALDLAHQECGRANLEMVRAETAERERDALRARAEAAEARLRQEEGAKMRLAEMYRAEVAMQRHIRERAEDRVFELEAAICDWDSRIVWDEPFEGYDEEMALHRLLVGHAKPPPQGIVGTGHAPDCDSYDFDPEQQLGPDKPCNCTDQCPAHPSGDQEK